MERLTNYNFNLDIHLIESIHGGDQEFEIIFYTRNKEKYKMVFDHVWDMRNEGYILIKQQLYRTYLCYYEI